jgi:hypothetical protein
MGIDARVALGVANGRLLIARPRNGPASGKTNLRFASSRGQA